LVCGDRRGRRHGWGCEARCKYVHVSSVGASMRLRAPQPHPCRRSTVGWCPLGKSQGEARGRARCGGPVHFTARAVGVGARGGGRFVGKVGRCRARLGTTPPTPCGRRRLLWFLTLLSMRHRGCVGGRWGWVGRALSRMDAATELTRVKTHCLRGIASHASERTAASGWAGPRSGTCSVPCQPTPTGPARHQRSAAVEVDLEVDLDLDLDLDLAPGLQPPTPTTFDCNGCRGAWGRL